MEEGSGEECQTHTPSLWLFVIRPNYGGADAWQPQSCSFN